MNKDELRELAREIVRSTKTEEYLPKLLSLNSEEIKVITPLIKEESHLYTQEHRRFIAEMTEKNDRILNEVRREMELTKKFLADNRREMELTKKVQADKTEEDKFCSVDGIISFSLIGKA